MSLLLLLLILALLLGLGGFAVHVLWIVAVILLVFWLIGLLFGGTGRL